jgi:hypothetical protein
MTNVSCTDMDCRHNKTLICQKSQIRSVLDDHHRQPERWICGDSEFYPNSGRKDPLESYIRKKKTVDKHKAPGRKRKTG